MNAVEARKRRGGSTLVERTRCDPARAARIDMLVLMSSLARTGGTIELKQKRAALHYLETKEHENDGELEKYPNR